MLGFIPTPTPEDPAERLPVGADDPRTYAHPSPALTAAQAIADEHAADGETGTVALLAIVAVDPDDFGACCPSCYAAQDTAHATSCPDGSGPVLVTSAVLRPVGEVVTR